MQFCELHRFQVNLDSYIFRNPVRPSYPASSLFSVFLFLIFLGRSEETLLAGYFLPQKASSPFYYCFFFRYQPPSSFLFGFFGFYKHIQWDPSYLKTWININYFIFGRAYYWNKVVNRWDEKEAIFKYLSHWIRQRHVPGKIDCEKCILRAGCTLQQKDWRSVKYYVKNQIDKMKRVFDPKNVNLEMKFWPFYHFCWSSFEVYFQLSKAGTRCSKRL